MVTFIVSGAGAINDISERVFGPTEEGKAYLKELFEQAHYMLFLVRGQERGERDGGEGGVLKGPLQW